MMKKDLLFRRVNVFRNHKRVGLMQSQPIEKNFHSKQSKNIKNFVVGVLLKLVLVCRYVNF
ncbi:hypothetical protein LINGRAHAP2_LOCUS7383 [Linum grandiflorum]